MSYAVELRVLRDDYSKPVAGDRVYIGNVLAGPTPRCGTTLSTKFTDSRGFVTFTGLTTAQFFFFFHGGEMFGPFKVREDGRHVTVGID